MLPCKLCGYRVVDDKGQPLRGLKRDGDLVAMLEAFQHVYLHGLAKATARVGERINLSFRHIVAE
jgi:hypothetical protein